MLGHDPDSAPSGPPLPVLEAVRRDEPAPRSRRSGGAPCALAVVALTLSLLVPLGSSGLWEPVEVEAAEFARRIAINLLGADELSLAGAVNEVPIRRELGRGELPFSSMALGFKLFGLSDWAARLPIALWALVGALATYALVARLANARAACLSSLVLCATPLYFVQARSLAGDGVTMAALALGLGGVGVALLDPRLTAWQRLPWLLGGALGLYAGFWCRGLLLGVGVPLAAVSVARLASSRASSALRRRRRLVDGALVLATTAVFALGLWALSRYASGGSYSILVGSSRAPVDTAASHDSALRALGHALFPVSALLPFAFANLLGSAASTGARSREYALRQLVAAALVAGFFVHAALAPVTGDLPFAVTPCCAIAVGLMLADLTERRRASRVVAMAAAALLVLLFFDFRVRPESSFAAFGVAHLKFPAVLETTHQRVWLAATLLVLVTFFFSVQAVESAPAAAAPGSRARADFRLYLASLRSAYRGNLWFGLVALWLLALSWCLALVIGERVLSLGLFSGWWSLARSAVLHAWWVLPALVLLAPLAVFALRDGVGWLGRKRHGRRARVSLSRTGLASLGLVVPGLFLGLYYYPKLAAEFSPKRVFEAYQVRANAGEPLALLGVSSSVAAYYTRSSPEWLATPVEAARWLAAEGPRRFLLVRASDLPELNALYRRSARPAENLPVIGTGPGEMSLASNRLGGERNQNPFEALVKNRAPVVAHPVAANLAGRLEVVGWQIRTEAGVLASVVLPGRPYRLELWYKVVGPFVDEWDTFVHVDGFGRRYNADHETLQGRYPMRWWNKGDIIVDEHPITLDPNFTPGDYRLYFGMYRGQRRLPVTRGRHDADRVDAGVVTVR